MISQQSSTSLNNQLSNASSSHLDKLDEQKPSMLTVFLVGLSSDFTADMLKNHFIYNLKMTSILEVNMPKINKSHNRHSKQKFLGCGTMTLTNEKELKMMLRAGSYKFKGRKFFVKPYLVGDALSKFKEQIQKKRVFVHNIPKGVSNEQLGEIFMCFGDVEDSYLIRSNKCRKYKASPRKYGYVIFEREEDAKRAIRAKRIMHKGHKLLVMPFTKKDQKTSNQNNHSKRNTTSSPYEQVRRQQPHMSTQNSIKYKNSLEMDAPSNPQKYAKQPQIQECSDSSSSKQETSETMREILSVSKRINCHHIPGNYKFNPKPNKVKVNYPYSYRYPVYSYRVTPYAYMY